VVTALILAVAILCELGAAISMRASQGYTRKVFLIPMIAGYGVSWACLVAVLDRGMKIGVTYGIWAACGIALTTLVSRFVFHDPLTKTMVAGLALIAAGVLLVEISAH
jgi:small multidrug resistance pump